MRLLIFICTLVFLFAGQTSGFAAPQVWVTATGQDLLIKFKGNTSIFRQVQTQRKMNVASSQTFKMLGGIEHWAFHVPMDASLVIAALKNDPNVEFVEPNYPRYKRVIPNDTNFRRQWGLHNVGQYIGATVGVDMHMPAAWNTQTGSKNVIVAVIDDSIDIHHEDLYANIWTNMGEIAGNGIDDDGNGYIDDVHGWDFVNNDNNPSADVGTGEGHGTMVSGCIGAMGNNALGVSGVNWNVSIMPLKFLGDVASELAAINYAVANGAKIVNASWGGPQFSYAESAGMKQMLNAGVLLVAAAGNYDGDNDRVLDYPSSLPYANILAVSALDANGKLTSWTHYGATTVDIAAPGHTIYTTSSKNVAAGFYDYTSGTSFSAPYVAGVAGLILAQYPTSTYMDMKGRILASASPMAQHGYSATDGYVNADLALTIAPQSELVISGLGVSDNNNNAIDPNENIQLSITLENIWKPATGITGTLTTTDTWVTVSPASQLWANMASGAKVASTTAFTITTGDFKGFRRIPFVLNITTTEGATFTRYFTLDSGQLKPDTTYDANTMQFDQDEFQYFHIDVPAGATTLNVSTYSSANIDILLRPAGQPLFDYTLYDINPVYGHDSQTLVAAKTKTGGEQIVVSNPQAGTWYVVVVSFDQKKATYQIKASLISNQGLAGVVNANNGSSSNGGGGSGGCFIKPTLPPVGLLLIIILALYLRRRA